MGLKNNRSLMLVICIFYVGIFSIASAEWRESVDVIRGSWGTNDAQFGIKHADTNDVFGGPFYILIDGRLMVTDLVNGRRKIYSEDGTLTRIIKCIKSSSGQWNEECRIPLDDYIQTMPDGNIWVGLFSYRKQRYSLYMPNGSLIKSVNIRPPELGQIKSEKRGENRYKITISYPDKIYGLSADREFVKYVRTTNDKVYGVNPGGAWRFNQCGRVEGYLLMPEGQMDEIPGQGREEPQVYVHSEYGEPVVAPNGDVYTWHYTPDAYKILKWTWVDDPNVPTGPDAPTGLMVMPSLNGLYLTWTASPQDPGCVTGYEISRATSAGGAGSTIATVNAGILKYNDATASAGTTYYYKIRAAAGSEYSPFSAEVSGKR